MEVHALFSEEFNGWYVVIINHRVKEKIIKFNDFYPTEQEALDAFMQIPVNN